MHRSIFVALIILGLILAPSSPASGSPLNERERLKLFEEVWNLVRTEYYDPGFGGVDWVAVGDRYRQRLASARTDDEIHGLLQEMLAELHDSHTYYDPPATSGGGPRPTLGIEVDEVEGQLVVASVDGSSEATHQGGRPGMILRTMNGQDLRERARELDAYFPTSFGISSERILTIFRLRALLNGPAGEEVTLGLSDPSGQRLEIRVHRAHVSKPAPPVSSRRLTPDMGYIRWTTWDPALTESIRAQLASLRDTRSLVIDLRGNSGGDPQVAVDVLRCLAGEIPYGRFQGPRPFRKVKARKSACPFVYTGSLAVLMNRETGSTSEIFANLIQETGRGRLVGAQSSGSVLYHLGERVRGGGMVWLSMWDYTSPRGRRLQGDGVLPDVPVQRTIASLWQGRDEALEAAEEILGRPAS
jgi:carboxyl-terminal processing protease